MTTCGTKCFGASSCVAKCITGKEGYSKDCAACFGDLGACTEKHCLSKVKDTRVTHSLQHTSEQHTAPLPHSPTFPSHHPFIIPPHLPP